MENSFQSSCVKSRKTTEDDLTNFISEKIKNLPFPEERVLSNGGGHVLNYVFSFLTQNVMKTNSHYGHQGTPKNIINKCDDLLTDFLSGNDGKDISQKVMANLPVSFKFSWLYLRIIFDFSGKFNLLQGIDGEVISKSGEKIPFKLLMTHTLQQLGYDEQGELVSQKKKPEKIENRRIVIVEQNIFNTIDNYCNKILKDFVLPYELIRLVENIKDFISKKIILNDDFSNKNLQAIMDNRVLKKLFSYRVHSYLSKLELFSIEIKKYIEFTVVKEFISALEQFINSYKKLYADFQMPKQQERYILDEFTEAIKYFEPGFLLDLNLNDANLCSDCGWQAKENGKYEIALCLFEYAFQLKQDKFSSISEKSKFYNRIAVAQDYLFLYDKAIQSYDEAIKLNPEADYMENRGYVYLTKNDYQRAVSDFSRIEGKKEEHIVNNNLGCVYRKSKNLKKQLNVLDKLLNCSLQGQFT